MKKIFICLLFIMYFIFSVSLVKVSKNIINEKIVFIDPGHGGEDGGTNYNGILEKNINLKFAFTLKEVLNREGYKVFLTRDSDYDLASEMSKLRKREDILKRVDLINSSDCFLYLSIHTNSYSSNKVHGAQVFYNSNNIDSKNLANCIQKSIVKEVKNTSRVALAIRNKYLVDNTKKVGCLIEIGFLSNDEERLLLQSEGYQIVLSEAILLGIKEYEKMIA